MPTLAMGIPISYRFHLPRAGAVEEMGSGEARAQARRASQKNSCCTMAFVRLVDDISSQVARILKEERRARGLSLNVLARNAGVARQTVSYIEQEIQSPTLDTLLRITAALEVHLENVISEARRRCQKG